MINAIAAAIGLVLLVAAALLVSIPLGLAVAGVGLVVSAYVKQYLEAQREATRAPGRR